MRYTTWLIYSDGKVMLRGGGYGLACVNEDGSVNFGFGSKDINKNNPYRDAPESDVKKIRNNALLVKIPKIDKFMGEMASKLYYSRPDEPAYNKALGLRRANAAKALVDGSSSRSLG